MTTDADVQPAYSVEEAEYRATLRSWLEVNMEPTAEEAGFKPYQWMPSPELEVAQHEANRARYAQLYAAGYVGIAVPAVYGGQGGEAWMQRAFNEESVGWQVQTGFFHSIASMSVPALLHFGTEAQKQAHIRGLLDGSVSWCQLFSEPGAGSDLAGLGTRAERDGDEYVINGQKVWNSAAMYADMGILLVRTDPDVPKHKGITFLLFDMRQPGVEVRRLVQAHGAGHFAEVFIDNARCPVDNVLGDVDAGWGPTRLVMANESAMIGGASSDRAEQLVTLARMLGKNDDPIIRQRLAEIYTRQKLLDQMGAAISAAARQRQPLPIHPSIVKLFVAQNRRHEGDLAQQLMGPAGVATTHEASEWAMEQLHARFPISIGGGTDEVHHNNLGEQALGLPRDIRTDKDVAWKDVPKG